MEGFLKLLLACIVGVALAGLTLGAFAYSPHFTHPDLTEQMVEFYNSSVSGQEIKGEFVSSLRKGSIDEDIAPRWVNHFYDPQSGEGWTGEHLGPHDKETVQQTSQLLLAINFTPMPAPKWAVDQNTQNLFINYGWNHTWQKAIYDYVNGRETEAFESLGYILHLIEDMSVPDHTRNDSHPHIAGDPGSPYEDWARDFTNGNKLATADKLKQENAQMPKFSNLKEAFDYVAKYSNENFFSEETINEMKYSNPRVIEFKTQGLFTYALGITSTGERIILYKFSNQDIKTATLKDEGILSQYFAYLSKQSVLAGAGVIDLFFREAEKAKQDPRLLETPPQPPNSLGTIGTYLSTRVFSPYGTLAPLIESFFETTTLVQSWWQKSIDGFKETVFNTASVLYGTSVKLSDLEEGNEMPAVTQTAPSLSPSPAVVESQPQQPAPQKVAANSASDVSESVGGALDAVLDGAEVLPPPPTPDAAITNGGLPSGGASAGSLGSISAPGAGAAPIDNASASPTTQQNQNEPATSTPPASPPDTTPPDIAFSISECGNSISAETCFLTSPTLHLAWSSGADDFDHFEISCEAGGSLCPGFSFAPTSATSTEYSASLEKQLYAFKAKAVDKNGNASPEDARLVYVASTPVVINEVAWMGTGSSATTSKDEWIELYNPTGYSVNLSGWTLSFFTPATTTPSHTIALSRTITAKGFYLIERTNDTAVMDVAADLTSSFGTSGLLNSGMIVKLERDINIIDRTPELCGGAWCAGTASSYNFPYYATMERIDSLVTGDGAANWATHIGEFILNGTNADGGLINGTPKKRNSVSYLISQTGTLVQNKTLIKDNSPYLITRSGLTVSSGVTLTLNPGAVVKFVSLNEPSLVINGTIKSNGSAAEPAVFTAFSDDTYGGDMNADGICDPGNASSTAACPTPGSWKQILVNASSAGSEFRNTIIRYGGRWFANTALKGMVGVDSTSALFDAVTLEYAQKHGLYLNASGSEIRQSTIRYNNTDSDAAGIYAAGGSPTISQNTFQQNIVGLQLEGSSAAVNNNTFTNNSSYAVNSSGAIGSFSGNSGLGNGKNGILLQNQLAASGATTTLSANPLPYLLNNAGASVPAGAGLIVSNGVVFKGEAESRLNVSGAMEIAGSGKDGVLFTSFADTAAGEWKGIAVNPGGLVYGGGFTLRYGGGAPSGCFGSCAGFKIDGGTVALSNGRIEKNFTAGMRVINSGAASLSNFEFNDNVTVTYGSQSFSATALILDGASAVLENVSFTGNTLGISSSASTLNASSVTFTNNTTNTEPADLIP